MRIHLPQFREEHKPVLRTLSKALSLMSLCLWSVDTSQSVQTSGYCWKWLLDRITMIEISRSFAANSAYCSENYTSIAPFYHNVKKKTFFRHLSVIFFIECSIFKVNLLSRLFLELSSSHLACYIASAG